MKKQQRKQDVPSQADSRNCPIGTCDLCHASPVKLRRSDYFPEMVCTKCFKPHYNRSKRATCDAGKLSARLVRGRPADWRIPPEHVQDVMLHFKRMAISLACEANRTMD